jgi:hypothetical protein
MATIAQRQEELVREEKRIFLAAARYEVFSLVQLWEEMKWINYGRLSRILLKWWREEGLIERLDKKGNWVMGYPFTQAGKASTRFTGMKAIYRWVGEQ